MISSYVKVFCALNKFNGDKDKVCDYLCITDAEFEYQITFGKNRWEERKNLKYKPYTYDKRVVPNSLNDRIKGIEVKSLFEIEKSHILNVLELTLNNKLHTSELLGISVKTLYNKLKCYGIDLTTIGK